MRIRTLGKVLAASLTAGALLALSLPAQAHSGGTNTGFTGGRSGTDPADDPLDPFLATVTPQHAVAPATYHNANTNEVDILSWSAQRVDLPGGPALKASWTVATNLPLPDFQTLPRTNPYPSFNGYSFDINWHNKVMQTNNPSSPRNRQCLRAAPGDIGKPDPRNHDADPNNNTYVYSPYAGHWLDSYWWQIGISLSFIPAGSGAGTGTYEATPQLSRFFPGPDGGYSFFDLKTNKYLNPSGPGSGKGTYYDYTVSGSTITVTVVTAWVEKSGACENPNWVATDPSTHVGPRNFQFILPGETVSNVNAKTYLNQVVILPNGGIPLSQIPKVICDQEILTCENIEAIGGFIYGADWSQQQIGAGTFEDYEIGIAGPDQLNTDIGTQVGLRCWTPTFGGTLPRNPLWVDNQPCGVDNPIGPEYRISNNDFLF